MSSNSFAEVFSSAVTSFGSIPARYFLIPVYFCQIVCHKFFTGCTTLGAIFSAHRTIPFHVATAPFFIPLAIGFTSGTGARSARLPTHCRAREAIGFSLSNRLAYCNADCAGAVSIIGLTIGSTTGCSAAPTGVIAVATALPP
jgi:hypothetical protein